MALQISGAISGMDTAAIVEQLMSMERQSRNSYVDRLNTYQWRQDALRGVKTDLLALKNLSADFDDIFNYTPMGGTSSDESKITAETTTNSLPGTYKFENVVLATTETWKSNSEISSDTAGQSGSKVGLSLGALDTWAAAGFDNTPDGTVTITQGGALTKTYNVTDYTTPFDFMAAISTDLDIDFVDGGGFVQIVDIFGNGYSISETGTNGFLTEAGLKFVDTGATLATLNAENYIDNDFADGTLTINGEAITVAIATDTINSLISKINSSAADVTAFYDANQERIVLSRKTAGDQDIVIDQGATNFATVFNLVGTSTGGQNTTFDLNGVSMERTSNTFEINNTTFSLLQDTAAGESVTVTVDKDSDTVIEDVQAWIDKYNEVMNTIHTYLTEEKVESPTTVAEATQGILRNDSTLRSLYQTLSSLTSSSVTGLPADMSNLVSAGISKGSDGQLSISSEATLRDTIRNDFSRLEDLFTTKGAGLDTSGYAERLEDLLAGYTTSTSGIMDLRISNESTGEKRAETQLERFDSRLESVEERYWNQFMEMEQALSALQSQSSWISGQVAGLNQNWSF